MSDSDGRRPLDYRLQRSQQLTSSGHGFALNAMRGLFLSNGAAAIALLAVVGNLISRGEPQANQAALALSPSLTWFATGVALSVACSILSYISDGFNSALYMISYIDATNDEALVEDLGGASDPERMRRSKNFARRIGKLGFFCAYLTGAGSMICFLVGVSRADGAVVELVIAAGGYYP